MYLYIYMFRCILYFLPFKTEVKLAARVPNPAFKDGVILLIQTSAYHDHGKNPLKLS